MSYKTVNVRPDTYERLKMYQIGGTSLSDVIDRLMARVDPEEVFEEALRIHRRRVAATRKRGGLRLAELRKKIDEEL